MHQTGSDECTCGSGLEGEALYKDGLFLCYVCDKCRDWKPQRFLNVSLGWYDNKEGQE